MSHDSSKHWGFFISIVNFLLLKSFVKIISQELPDAEHLRILNETFVLAIFLPFLLSVINSKSC